MSIEKEEAERALEAHGFERTRQTKKVVEYRISRNGKIVYFRADIGLPNYVRIVVHPNESAASLAVIPGVAINAPKELQHGSNMTAFPRKKNEGQDEIHYGRAFNISSVSALSAFAAVLNSL